MLEQQLNRGVFCEARSTEKKVTYVFENRAVPEAKRYKECSRAGQQNGRAQRSELQQEVRCLKQS